MTAANFLRELNASERIVDIEGNEAAPVAWECACLQKKCGACAMRINRHPVLACSVFLKDAANNRGEILLEPLGKFPVIRDLKVDRSMISERLKEMRVWLTEKKTYEFDQSPDLQFQAARCMLCGICLEVCPTFGCNPDFAGATGSISSITAAKVSPVSKRVPCICLWRNCRPPQTARLSGRRNDLFLNDSASVDTGLGPFFRFFQKNNPENKKTFDTGKNKTLLKKSS